MTREVFDTRQVSWKCGSHQLVKLALRLVPEAARCCHPLSCKTARFGSGRIAHWQLYSTNAPWRMRLFARFHLNSPGDVTERDPRNRIGDISPLLKPTWHMERAVVDTFLTGKWCFLSTSAIVWNDRFERVYIDNRQRFGYRSVSHAWKCAWAVAVPTINSLSRGLAFPGLIRLSGLWCDVLKNISSKKCGLCVVWLC